MSIQKKIIAEGKIDKTSLINFPSYLLVKNNSSYKLIVDNDANTSLKLIINIPAAAIPTDETGYTLTLPIFIDLPDYAYDFCINWGDGSGEAHYTSSENVSHKYTTSGEYKILIQNNFPGFNNSFYKIKNMANPWEYLTSIESWR
jgi:hypothetical protein